MGRAKRIGGGTPETGLAIEYVRKRKVVRLVGRLSGTPIEAVEIPVVELCGGLGISPADLRASQTFLLFAGSHRRPAGGLRDLVGTYEVEEHAWAAFRALRQAHPASQGWAELASVDAAGHVNQLAWFGLHPAESVEDEPSRSSPARRRQESSAYLRAVTPS
jgi:hypothetical protein